MKLSKASVFTIENVLKSIKFVDVNEVIITNTQAKGFNPDRTGFVLADIDIPEKIGQMAINRPDIFLNRFNLIKDDDNFEVEFKTKGIDDDILTSELVFKSSKVTLEYRCGLPKLIKAPSSINDKPTYKIPITKESVALFTKASNATDSSLVTLVAKNGELTLETVDLTNDIVNIRLDDAASRVDTADDTPINFNFSFVSKLLTKLMKETSDDYLLIGKRGLLHIKVNNVNLTLYPRT